jgi:2-C-methyl-D-erythritol 2,4-cyclodiphosphate synthase
MTPRIGLGFDAHPFTAARPLRLGGVELAHTEGLEGHSDGDVLLHAIADAILGAAGLASLGEHFADAERAWEAADSALFLRQACALAGKEGLTVGHVDAVVVAERPRIAPHRERLRSRIAEILELPLARVNVRGTSTNGLGFPGRGEGIAAMAVVLLEPKERDENAT